MSKHAIFNYHFEVARRREAYLNRLRENTRKFLGRYRAEYEKMQANRYEEVIPLEMAELSARLAQVEVLLATDVEAARNLSLEIGATIGRNWSLGHEMSRKLAEAERRHQHEEMVQRKSRLFEVFERQQSQIHDPVVRDFARQDLSRLRQDLTNSNPDVGESILGSRLTAIIERASQRAAEWKTEQERTRKLVEAENARSRQEREAHLQRVRQTTATCLDRYRASYEEMRGRGFEEVIPAEMEQLRQRLQEIDKTLGNNPASAQELSNQVRDTIGKLWALGRESRQRLAEAERRKDRQEKSEQKSRLIENFETEQSKIKDPVVRDFARDALKDLRRDLMASRNDIDEAALRQRLDVIIESAEEQASKWKSAQEETQRIVEEDSAKSRRDREAYLNRIRDNTQNFLNRFRTASERMKEEGLEELIPEELARLKTDLDRIESCLEDDPEAARFISLQVGASLERVWSSGREARRRTIPEEKAELPVAPQTKEAASDLMDLLDGELRKINDPIVRDFVREEVSAIRQDIARGQETNTAKLRKRLGKLQEKASKQAAQWKAEVEQQNRKESQRRQIELVEEEIARAEQENPEAMRPILETLRNHKAKAKEGGLKGESLEGILKRALKESDDACADEQIRKEVVRSVRDSLKRAGFVVDDPKRIKEGGQDVVAITASKPSGNQASIRVDSNGRFEYRFDQYEGTACKKDIARFTKELKEIYGIELSNERVISDVPEPDKRQARPIPTTENRQQG